jgi:hypothetical protein
MNEQDNPHNPNALSPAQERAQLIDDTLNAAWRDHAAGTITADGLREAVYCALFKMRFRRRPTLERLHDIAFQILWTPTETGRAVQSECIWDYERRKPRKNAKQGETFAEFVRRLATNGYDALQREEWEEDKRKLQTERSIDAKEEDELANPTAIPLPPADREPLLANAALDDPELRAGLRLAEQRYRQRHPAVARYHLNGAGSASEVESLIRKNGDPSHVTGRKAISKKMADFERELESIAANHLRTKGASAGLDWDDERELVLTTLGLSKSKGKCKGRIKPAHTRRVVESEDPWETIEAELTADIVAETDGDDAEDDIPSDLWPTVLPVVARDLTPDHRFPWTWELMLAEDERSSVGRDTGTVAFSEKEEAVVA